MCQRKSCICSKFAIYEYGFNAVIAEKGFIHTFPSTLKISPFSNQEQST